MTDPGISSTEKSPTEKSRAEESLWRRATRSQLATLPGPPVERSRIEEELAQMLRDEAEAGGVDCHDPISVEAWISTQSHRLRALVEDLDLNMPAQEVQIGQPAAVPSSASSSAHWLVGGLLADFKMAFRSLRRRPGLSSVIILTLILGIGLNSAVFSVLDSILFRPSAVTEPERLMRVYSNVPNNFVPDEPMAFPDILDISGSPVVEGVAAEALTFAAISTGGKAEVVIAEMVTDNYFEVLGVRPARGRLFSSPRMLGNEGNVTVISSAAWQRHFSSDSQVLGQVVRLNGQPFEIIGVVPQNFRGLARGIEPEFFMPLEAAIRVGASPSTNSGSSTEESLIDDRFRRSFWPVVRIKDGVEFAQAEAELMNLALGLQRQFPKSNEDRALIARPYLSVKVLPFLDANVKAVSFVLLGLVFLVLLIASANLANLLLARALGRRGEMATRLSLGASRGRIVRQLLVESLTMAAIGAFGGLVVAWVVSWLVSQVRLDMVVPLQVAVNLDLRVVLFTSAVAAVASVIFGLVPALEASNADLASVMKESAGRGGKRMRFQSALVCLQVAFSVVLMIFAGLALRSVTNATRIDIGMETASAAGALLSPEIQGYDEVQITAFYQQLTERLEATPGVERVSTASHLPLSMFINSDEVAPSHLAGLDEDEWPTVDLAWVDDTYFQVLGIPVLSGRGFTATELADGAKVVIVNRAAAEEFWPENEAVGQLLKSHPDRDPATVVGVVENGKYRTLGERDRSFVYYPIAKDWATRAVVVQFENQEQVRRDIVAKVAESIDPHLALSSVGTVDEMISSSVLIPKLAASVFGGLGLVGLLLSAIGLFGVLANAVSQRTHEIGLRIAMGASRWNVLVLVARRGLGLVLGGIVLGTTVAFAATRFLSMMLYGISPTDLLTFVSVVVVLLLVALAATLLPARAALRVSPTEALRYQ